MLVLFAEFPAPMSIYKKAAYLLLLVVALPLAGKLVHTTLLAQAVGCTDHTLQTLDAPDAKHVLTIYNRSCGATAPDTTQVNVQQAGVVYDDDESRPFWIAGVAKDLKVRWESPTQIVVTVKDAGRIYRNETTALGLQIRYEISAPPR